MSHYLFTKPFIHDGFLDKDLGLIDRGGVTEIVEFSGPIPVLCLRLSIEMEQRILRGDETLRAVHLHIETEELSFVDL